MKQKSVVVRISLLALALVAVADGSINGGGNRGVVRILSAQTQGFLKMNLMVGVGYGQSSDYLKGPVDSNGVLQEKPVSSDGYPVGIVEPARLISSNISASIGLLPFWDFSFTLPFYFDWAGFGDLSDGGLGDLEVTTKLRQPPIGNLLFQSYLFGVTAPVGMRDRGLFPRHPYLIDEKGNKSEFNPAKSFYSYEKPMLKGMMLWTLDMVGGKYKIPLSFDLNLGAVLSTDWQKRNTALGGLAIAYSPADFFTMFVECSGEARWSSFNSGIDIAKDPFYVTPGIRITTPAGVYLYLAGDFCVSSHANSARNNWAKPENSDPYRYSTLPAPTYGIQLALGWNGFLTVQDDDHDGLRNEIDRCPNQPEDIDGFEDYDGCPDPDNEKDGIPDVLDKCSNVPEDMDGFQDSDGCPDLDNDKDGIPDLKDNCPDAAEDFDGFEDRDGCPDFDNDKDGVSDSLDKCPNSPEDIDGFQDNDGCPDLDNDQDGIPDLKDKCPNQAENFNNYQDDDGCLDTLPPEPVRKKEPEMPRQQIIGGLQFQPKTSGIQGESFHALDPLIKIMKEFLDVEIEVRGYFDTADKTENPIQISQLRADVVRQYLVSQGIAPQRMRSIGMGSSYPIADSRSAAGRNKNRRIEIIRTR